MSESDNLFIDGRPISDLKVVELRHELEIRNLPKSGKKNELVERLRNYLLTNEEEDVEQSGQRNKANYKEYRSLTEIRPVSKSPTKSPLKSPSTSSGTVSPTKSTMQSDGSKTLTEETQTVTTEETFHTANDETAYFNSSENEDPIEESNSNIFQETLASVEDKKAESENVPQSDGVEISLINENTINKDDVAHLSENIEGADEKLHTQTVDDTIEEEEEEEKQVNVQIEKQSIKEVDDNIQEIVDVNVIEDEEIIDEEKQGKGDDDLDYDEDVQESHNEDAVDAATITDKKDFDSNIHKEQDDTKDNIIEKACNSSYGSDLLNTTDDKHNMESELKMKDIITPEGFLRRRDVSPARNKPSEYLHIRNLKRPFTVKALKELLNNFGAISDDEFWIDNIKTNCIVKFESNEQAELARSRLHHVVWPSSSDTSLIVEFTTEDKLSRRRDDDVSIKKSSEPANITILVENTRDSSSKLEKADLNDLYLNSRKRKCEDTPKKSLDDLFKKTVAKPPVYYLPLSESEAEKRWAEKVKPNKFNGHRNIDSRQRNVDGGGRHSSVSRKRGRRDSPIHRRY